ncbi:hypothetical protein Fot_24558 [Forsythia ovata]|uniref:Uncharacterized protein n=1 Tax=Forsythia ovata TaxID=205694 RepID=A0ABD1U6I9_9LAMI
MAEASKSDEHKKCLDEEWLVLDNILFAYEKLESDLKEFEKNVFKQIKKLDNANLLQNVVAVGFKRDNGGEKIQKEEMSSRQFEMDKLQVGVVAGQAKIAKLKIDLEIS